MGEEDVRRLALAFSEVVEMDHHGIPSFRVRDKIFCTVRSNGTRMMVKLHPEDQHNLCAGRPDILEPVPGYWGTKGSTFVDLSKIDEAFAETLLRLAYANVAPKRLKP
ncbi:MAG TPA: MmcQ/YjbR family DNA-binding protein [Caulobacteraceae bacterium]